MVVDQDPRLGEGRPERVVDPIVIVRKPQLRGIVGEMDPLRTGSFAFTASGAICTGSSTEITRPSGMTLPTEYGSNSHSRCNPFAAIASSTGPAGASRQLFRKRSFTAPA